MKQLFKMFSQNFIFPIAYRMFCCHKIQDGLVLFADAHCFKRPFRMHALYEELKDRGYMIKECYVDYQSISYFQILKEALVFMKWYARANYVVISDNFLPVSACKKRRGTFVIQLWHACGAFKKFGYDTEDDIPNFYKGNVFKNYDLVTVSGKLAMKPFSSAMRLQEGICKPVGVSATDCYYDEDYRLQCSEDFYKEYPEALGKKLLLWAPTFRGNASNPCLVGEEIFEDVVKALRDQWFIIVKKHPHMEQKGQKSSIDIPTERLLPITDLLITDYSSIIFNYAIFKKPIVFFAPDLDTYKRGFYLRYEELPGTIAKDGVSLLRAIQDAGNDFDQKKMEQFSTSYMDACDGNATKRIADIMDAKRWKNEL